MNTLNIKYKMLCILMLAVIGGSGCKKFLDTNENPNMVTSTKPELSLPVAMAAISHELGNPLQIHGGIWAQYWTQNTRSSQYRSLEDYAVTSPTFDRPWRLIYSDCLQDLQEIFNYYSTHENYKQYAAIAYIMKAYTYHVATDAWGDIPMTEAINPAISSPHYTPQQQIYDSIIENINKGISLIDVNAALKPKTDDLIFQGDMAQWLRFANTFKLRVYLRMSEVAPQKASAGIATLNGAQFLENDAKISYSTTGGNQNPLFSEILGLTRVQNLVASETSVKFFRDNKDPRADVFYTRFKKGAIDSIIGLQQGDYNNSSDTFSFPSPAVGGLGEDDNSANAPVKFISAAESYFLQAEAVTRGWLTSTMSAKTLFETGIRASFKSYNVPGVDNYIATAPAAQWPAGATQRIRAIIIQKWAAMNGNQSFEAWTEWRRTGYPDFFTVSVESTLAAGKMPVRILYPSTESTTNLNYPGQKLIDVPVWWDVN
jgi:hypothetical protein